MNNKQYLVRFVSGKFEMVWAGSTQTAKILAQAIQIDKGNPYAVQGVKEWGV